MRFVPLAVLLCCLAPAPGQTSPPSPATPNKPEFGFRPPAAPGKPQFWLHVPNQSEPFLVPPAPKAEVQPRPGMDWGLDPGIIRKPQGFAQQPSRPAQPRDLYPSLKIQPTEIARTESPSCPRLEFKAEPIPREYPKAKVDFIPTTWDCYRMVPVESTPKSNR